MLKFKQIGLVHVQNSCIADGRGDHPSRHLLWDLCRSCCCQTTVPNICMVETDACLCDSGSCWQHPKQPHARSLYLYGEFRWKNGKVKRCLNKWSLTPEYRGNIFFYINFRFAQTWTEKVSWEYVPFADVVNASNPEHHGHQLVIFWNTSGTYMLQCPVPVIVIVRAKYLKENRRWFGGTFVTRRISKRTYVGATFDHLPCLSWHGHAHVVLAGHPRSRIGVVSLLLCQWHFGVVPQC